MDLARLFLPFFVATLSNEFYIVLTISLDHFSPGRFLTENMCPEEKVIETAYVSSNVQCSFLCATQTHCHGVFLEQNATHCVLCSTKFFHQKNSTTSTFYKRHVEGPESIDTVVLPNSNVKEHTCTSFNQCNNEISWQSTCLVNLENPTTSFYLLIEQILTWYESKENCENLGGHLLILNSQEEMDFIYPYLVVSGLDSITIGANGTGGDAATFTWVDGSNVSSGYTNWGYGQPYTVVNGESYIIMVSIWGYRWNDYAIFDAASICEFKED